MTGMRSFRPMNALSRSSEESQGADVTSPMTRADWVRLSDEATVAWWELTPQERLCQAWAGFDAYVKAVGRPPRRRHRRSRDSRVLAPNLEGPGGTS
jgi:hypothetical protein